MRRAQTYMSWEREVLPALQRFDSELLATWVIRDTPSPGQVWARQELTAAELAFAYNETCQPRHCPFSRWTVLLPRC
jgi:hypothetical protein